MNQNRFAVVCSMTLLTLLCFLCFSAIAAKPGLGHKDILQVGKTLPDATLKYHGQADVRLSDLKGRVKLISIVPRLNTPVCDEQTHRFSEQKAALDSEVDIITISTNSAAGQSQFAEKTNIKNILFLSDKPDYDFGRNTGLLIEDMGVLRRTVLVVDGNNIIRYVDFVPGGGVPNIKKALRAAQSILNGMIN